MVRSLRCWARVARSALRCRPASRNAPTRVVFGLGKALRA
jgi:hypothetical protein